jgi:hypothetical protein
MAVPSGRNVRWKEDRWWQIGIGPYLGTMLEMAIADRQGKHPSR